MKAWEDLLSTLEMELGPLTVAQWLRPIKVVRFDAANLYLEATPFQRAWFEEQIRPRISKDFKNNNQRSIKIHWITSDSNKKQILPERIACLNPIPSGEGQDKLYDNAVTGDSRTASKSCGRTSSFHGGVPQSDFQITSDAVCNEYRIDNFIVSKSNRMASEMAKEICQSDQCIFNPVFFSGQSGCGKTHLISGIANSLINRGKKVFYVNAKTFTEHVVQAIRLGRMLEFRQSYRDIDALIVDDVQIFARRNATQEEFFHTFNTLHTEQRQIILAARENPGQLQDIEPRLISRFEWGITLHLDPPDLDDLKTILITKAQLLELSAPDHLLNFLIERFSSKPAASIEALHAIALRSPKNFDLVHIEYLLSDLLQKESHTELTSDKIISETALYFGIRTEDITGSSQMREFAQPRQIAMFLCRNILETPYQVMGRIFNRDHSTVMSSVKQIKNAVENKDRKFVEPVQAISRALHLKQNTSTLYTQ